MPDSRDDRDRALAGAGESGAARRADDQGRPDDAAPDAASREDEKEKHKSPNPPHTTKGGVTAPKFGSAGSGGAELEPGPERP